MKRVGVVALTATPPFVGLEMARSNEDEDAILTWLLEKRCPVSIERPRECPLVLRPEGRYGELYAETGIAENGAGRGALGSSSATRFARVGCLGGLSESVLRVRRSPLVDDVGGCAAGGSTAGGKMLTAIVFDDLTMAALTEASIP